MAACIVSSVAWLPRGALKPRPEAEEPSEEEVAALRARDAAAAAGTLDDHVEEEEEEEEMEESDEEEEAEETPRSARRNAAAAAAASAQPASVAFRVDARVEEALTGLHMETYDDEEAGEDVAAARLFGGSGPHTVFASNAEDPYITLQEDEDEEEASDFVLRDTDLVILAARTEDEVSHLELCVYEEATEDAEANLFVHHDLLLPAFPLALAWMDCPPGATDPGARGSFCAVGTMLPQIEIWDLDVLDAVEPVCVLGTPAPAAGEKKSKKKGKSGGEKSGEGHEAAVMGLAWNPEFRNVLASASADNTVKVWDVSAGRCEHTLTHHSDKVQSLAWNPATSSALLTGSFDQSCALVDIRTPPTAAGGGVVLRWQLGSDVECVVWSSVSSDQFLVSLENGNVGCFDARRGGGKEPMWTLAAHNKPCCALALNAAAPGLVATGSMDKTVKLWDIRGAGPEQLCSRDLQVGKVFTLGFCSSAPQLLAAAGSKGTVTVWDVMAEEGAARRFGAQMTGARR